MGNPAEDEPGRMAPKGGNMSNLTRRHLGGILLAAPFVLSGSGRAVGASLGQRPVTIIGPYGAGGGSDIMARAVADAMAPILGVPVVVENKPGAQGMIAAAELAQAEPDGHTLMAGSWGSQVALPIGDPSRASDPLEQFVMVSHLQAYEMIIATSKASGITSIEDLIERLRDPGTNLLHPSFGPTTPADLSVSILVQAAGGSATPVSYNNNAQAWLDAHAGRINFVADGVQGVVPQVNDGAAIALASLTTGRSKSFPEIPAVVEILPDAPKVDLVAWNALFAPVATPPEILVQLNDAVRKAMASESVQATLERLRYFDISGADAEQSQARWIEEIALWKPVIESLVQKP